jgi:hypothetical protein
MKHARAMLEVVALVLYAGSVVGALALILLVSAPPR